MNRESIRPRTAAPLTEATSRRLHSYALMAGAAGVGVLAVAPRSEAEIVYTPVHHVISRNHSFRLDLNHDGTTDFTINNIYPYTSCTEVCSFSVWLSVKPTLGNGAEGFTVHRRWAFALKGGARIGPSQYFVGTQMARVNSSSTYYQMGSWVNVRKRYLGLRFKIDGKNHYGWARLNVQVQGFDITATVTGYAYETVPRKAIVAGDTGAAASANTPRSDIAPLDLGSLQPASLGRLATGASGLAAWRQHKRAHDGQ